MDTSSIKGYLFSRAEIIASYVFGSTLSGSATSESDIDIAVLLDNNIDRNDYGLIRQDITASLIERVSFDKVDVAILNAASPLLCHEVIKNGELLFSKDERTRVAFTAKATKRYIDTIYLRRVQDRVLHKRIRSGDFGYFKGSHKYSIEKIRKGGPDTSAVK